MAGRLCDFTLGDCSTVKSSKRVFAREYVENGVPFFRSKDVIDKALGVFQNYDLFISDERFNELRVLTGSPTKGDILISSVGNRSGQPYVVQDEGDFYFKDGNIIWLSEFQGIDPGCLSYWLKSKAGQAVLASVMIGSAQKALTIDSIRKLHVALPKFDQQKRIANILGTLDNKIELNRRMNATLEAMARALFRSWFVDFDPVRAKADGRQPTGLDPATAALFPDSFQDSELGPIPEGWNVERFDAHVSVERGLSYKGAGLCDEGEGVPMHNLNSIYEGGRYKHKGIKYYKGDYKERHIVRPGDLIATNTEQGFDRLLIGYAAMVPDSYGDEGIISHHIYRVRIRDESPFTPHYLQKLINTRRWHNWISGFSNGTTINMLPKDAFAMPTLVVPPLQLVERFSKLAADSSAQIETNRLESRTLAALRDTLLPKLLSGELDLSDAAQQAEAQLDLAL